jgi:hypothetical protein
MVLYFVLDFNISFYAANMMVLEPRREDQIVCGTSGNIRQSSSPHPNRSECGSSASTNISETPLKNMGQYQNSPIPLLKAAREAPMNVFGGRSFRRDLSGIFKRPD